MATDTKTLTDTDAPTTPPKGPNGGRGSSVRGADAERLADCEAQLAAISNSQVVAQFTPDGVLLSANGNFLDVMGYTLDEVVGQQHRMFVSVDYGQSDGYRENWGRITRGEAVTGEYQRLTKSGRELWMRSSYDPVVDDDNNLIKVVEVGLDITDTKVRNADFQGQLDAISKAQAVIEFNLDGTVITANDNFLTAMGYALDDVVGQHHRMFVDPEYASSSDYTLFWEKLGRGEYVADEFKRIGRAARKSGCRRRTTRSSTSTASRSRSSSTRPTSPRPRSATADYQGQLAAISRRRRSSSSISTARSSPRTRTSSA